MMAELSLQRVSLATPVGKFVHHDLITLTEDYPYLYRDTRRGLPGLVRPFCALLAELVVIVIRKL